MSLLRVLEYRLLTRLNRSQALSIGAAMTAAGFATSCDDLGGQATPVYGAPCNPPSCVFPQAGAANKAGAGGAAGMGGKGGAPAAGEGGMPSEGGFANEGGAGGTPGVQGGAGGESLVGGQGGAGGEGGGS